MSVQNKNAILDKEGVILSLEREKDKTLPEIIGARLNDPQLVPGLPLRGSDIWLTLKIIDLFEANSSLDPYSIKNVNIENMSKIIISLSNQLDVIIDKERVDQRIKVLGIVLAQDRLDLKDVKYIDLRFKEPIIGKK
jgi:cell division septal protein FtsQ